MPITAQQVYDSAKAFVDAEGGQFYLPDQDWLPAINAAYQRAITACNWRLANNKGAEEQLAELQVDLLFRTNGLGVIDINLARLATSPATVNPFKCWSVIAAYAEPQRASLLPSVAVPAYPAPANASLSYYWDGGSSRPQGSKFPVQRMTKEQLAVANTNRYMAGSEALALDSAGAPSKMRSYGYYIAGDQQSINDSTSGDSPNISLLMKPFALSVNAWFWVSYLRTPNTLTAFTGTNTGTLSLPESMLRTIADWTLQYLSIKQGDQTTLNSTAREDASTLFQMST